MAVKKAAPKKAASKKQHKDTIYWAVLTRSLITWQAHSLYSTEKLAREAADTLSSRKGVIPAISVGTEHYADDSEHFHARNVKVERVELLG